MNTESTKASESHAMADPIPSTSRTDCKWREINSRLVASRDPNEDEGTGMTGDGYIVSPGKYENVLNLDMQHS